MHHAIFFNFKGFLQEHFLQQNLCIIKQTVGIVIFSVLISQI